MFHTGETEDSCFAPVKQSEGARVRTSKLMLPPGELESRKPKSMWMSEPLACSRMLPLCRSLTCSRGRGEKGGEGGKRWEKVGEGGRSLCRSLTCSRCVTIE